MKTLICGFVMSATVLASTMAFPRTLTWKLDPNTQGKFLDSQNWESDGQPAQPEPGDLLIVNVSGSAWNKIVKIGDATETFDFGSTGLTIQIDSGYVQLDVKFAGSGKLVKTGNGRYYLSCDSTHTGGTEIRAGYLCPNKDSLIQLGTGEIEFTTAYGASPSLSGADKFGCGFKNAVRFSGAWDGDYVALQTGQMYTFDGKVSAEHDVAFNGTYGTVTFNEEVVAEGCEISVDANRTVNEKMPPNFTFRKAVDASFKKTGNRNLTFEVGTQNPDNKLTVLAGSNILAAAAYWAGTNIVIDGATSVLVANKTTNLSKDAVIRVANGGTVRLPEQGTYAIKSLVVDGDELAPDVYDISSLSPSVVGTGKLFVSTGQGRMIAYKTWIGTKTGKFSDPANWSDMTAPHPGDIVEFPEIDGINLEAEEFDIGENGLTLIVPMKPNFWQGLLCGVTFKGSGKIIKKGNGILAIQQPSYHTGGTDVLDGRIRLYNKSAFPQQFGMSIMRFFAGEGKYPSVRTEDWGVGMVTPIAFSGDYGCYTNVLCSNPGTFNAVTSDSDMRIVSSYATLTFTGAVSAVGKTIAVEAIPSNIATPQTPCVKFNSNVDASLVVNALTTTTSVCSISLKGVSENPDNGMTLNSGKLILETSAKWGGTNVVVNGIVGVPTELVLQGSKNLSESAVLSISTACGAKINIASGLKLQIAEMFVDGVRLADGVYSAARLPNVIKGGGKIKVGNPGLMLLFR